VLTGETGAGKSILLDALSLALGGRGDGGLVRSGEKQGQVTALFEVPAEHPVTALLQANDIPDDGALILKRTQGADGRTRAFINDQPVSATLLRDVGQRLVEIHGQHADRALVDVSAHRRLLDAFGGHEADVAEVAALWASASAAEEALNEHRRLMERAEAERDYLEHAAEELRALNPIEGEEAKLAEARQMMMSAEQYADALGDAEEALAGDGTSVARLNAALRKLERRRETAGGRLDHVCQALDRVLAEITEAERAIAEAQRAFVFDPKELEKSEERLFALRAAARKYKCTVDTLAQVRERFDNELKALTDGGGRLKKLEQAFRAARDGYDAAAEKLSNKRRKTAKALDKAVMAELPPLKLERARFETALDTDAGKPGPTGIDRIEFMVAANPGTPLAPLMKVASGGELARFMLALKVILASKGSAPTLIFDEIDTGVGGAVADAIGARLSRLAGNLQVLAVTHSPQVAARASQHLLISKMEEVASKRMVTRVQPLADGSRREEVARMLSGAKVTEAARAQADELLQGRG